MLTLGIDIGSTTSKCAVVRDGSEILSTSLYVGGIGTKSPGRAVSEVLERAGITADDLAGSAVTGYGRTRYEGADFQVSELTCHALGAHLIFPEVRTIIDIGGQDAKVISLNAEGRMESFLMNDKCAAGTGRFLDVMATILQIPVDEFSEYAARSEKPAAISSTCTVFAESEVISQLSQGVETPDLVAGICASVASRVAALAKRSPLTPAICMSGGVARCSAVRDAMSRSLGGKEVLFSPYAQLFGALGAAVSAFQKQ